MTDQGKPSVCPTCGSGNRDLRAKRDSGLTVGMHFKRCGDEWHSSPVPAATTETELLEKAARKVVATFSDENIAAGLAFVMADFGDEAKVSALQAVPAATTTPVQVTRIEEIAEDLAAAIYEVQHGTDEMAIKTLLLDFAKEIQRAAIEPTGF